MLEDSALDVQDAASDEDEEVEEFRAFLDTVNADDFVGTDEGDKGPSS